VSVDELVAALDLPPQARVDQRVPKKLLVENGAPTPADKRQIESGIEELRWLAAVKPTTIGVPAFKDDMREYLEIAVLSIAFRADAKAARLVELVHRAIPYPVVLVAEQGGALSMSLAHKRHSQGEAGQTVLDGAAVVAPIARQLSATPDFRSPTPAFLASLSLAALPKSDLYALYAAWVACLEAWQAAQLTGSFTPSADSAARREGLAAQSRLTREIAGLRAQADRERQTSRRVDLNLQIKKLESALAAAIAQLSPPSPSPSPQP